MFSAIRNEVGRYNTFTNKNWRGVSATQTNIFIISQHVSAQIGHHQVRHGKDPNDDGIL
jgi:hypothetical protein